MPKHYELLDDRQSKGRWHLGPPQDKHGKEIDPWQFKEGRTLKFDHTPRFTLDVPGHPLDFCWAAYSIPVVTEHFTKLFKKLHIKGVQFIPTHVENHPEPCFILNALQIVRCIDDKRSGEVQHWKPEDNRPDKLGEYRAIHRMRIDPAKAGDTQIFRPWGWRVALIIAEDIKQGIESAGLSGVRFVEV